MWWLTFALAAPESAYGLSETDGTVVFDARGVAHGCLDGPTSRIDGVVGGGVELHGGRIVLPAGSGDSVTVALYARGDGDGVLVSFGDVELAIEGGEWMLSGTPISGGLAAETWRHVAVGVDGGIASLWVAQVNVGSALVDAANGPLMIGGRPDGSGSWRGDVDEVAVVRASPADAELALLTTGFGGPSVGAECGDYDLDGLDDVVELALGTDPEARDSDRDTFDDGTEIGDLSDPRDSDNDGTIDALDDDDDGDGIPSLTERISDADGDGSPDLDPDGDGLENGIDLDSDGDGRSDADEGITDTDGDGILDFLDAVDDANTDPTTTDEPQGGVDGSKDEAGCQCSQGRGVVDWRWALMRR